MSVSGELLCSFELLKPLDSSALKSHIKKGRNKRQNMLNSPVSGLLRGVYDETDESVAREPISSELLKCFKPVHSVRVPRTAPCYPKTSRKNDMCIFGLRRRKFTDLADDEPGLFLRFPPTMLEGFKPQFATEHTGKWSMSLNPAERGYWHWNATMSKGLRKPS